MTLLEPVPDLPAVGAAVVEHAREVARVVAGQDGAEVPVDQLLPVLEQVAEARRYLDAALLGLTARLEAEPAVVAATGWASTKDLLTQLVGGARGEGGGLVRVAVQSRELPALRAGLAAGAVSLAQARAVTTAVASMPRDPGFRAAVAEGLVRRVVDDGVDATGLARSLPEVLATVDPTGEVMTWERTRDRAERGAHGARFLSFAEDAFGGVRIRAYATVEDVARVKAALLPLSAPVTTAPGACGGDPAKPGMSRTEHGKRRHCPDPTCEHDGRDVREAGARLWDALVEACERLTRAEVLPGDHGGRPRVVVHIEETDLRDRVRRATGEPGFRGDAPITERYEEDATPLGGGPRYEGGEPISIAALRRLACDAEVLPVVMGGAGEVLDVGRSQRLVTRALWVALVVRDRHCVFPGCTRPPIACDAHHVRHWANGGPTSLDNLVLLCRYHHTVVHHSPWAVAIDPVTRRPCWTPPPDRHRGRAGPVQPRAA